MIRNVFYLLAIIVVFVCCNNADNTSKSTATQNDSITNNNNASTEKNTTPATVTEQVTDSTLQYAYIKNIIKKADSVFIVTDFIQYLTGDEAVAAAKKNGDADTAYNEQGKITSVYVANDFYIMNSSKKLRQLVLSKVCVIKTLVSTTLKKTTMGNFIKIFPKDNLVFKLEIKNGEVIQISEVYMP